MSREWELPSTYVQLVTLGGWVFDISEQQASFIRNEMDTPLTWIVFEDIYGAECVVRGSNVVGFRQSTPESVAHYRAMHADDDEGTWA